MGTHPGKLRWLLIVSVACLLFASDLAAPAEGAGVSEAPSKARLQKAYDKLPLRFEPNRGQTDHEVKFLSRGSGYTLFLTAAEAVLALANRGDTNTSVATVLRMRLLGTDPCPRVVAREELAGRSAEDWGALRVAHTTFIVRVSSDEAGSLTGVVERARTGAKQRFCGADAIGRVIARMVDEDRMEAGSQHEAPGA